METASVKDMIKHLTDAQKSEVLDFLREQVNVYEVNGKRVISEYAIPVSAFSQGLSGLESVCVYLKDDIGLRFVEIGRELNRSPVTVRLSYRNGKKKYSGRLELSGDIRVPVALLSNRKKTVLQHVVAFLREKHKKSFKEIAGLLGRDYKTIWTAYSRGGKK